MWNSACRQGLLHFGHHPETPLGGDRVFVHVRRRERATEALRQVQVDRHRLEQAEPVVIDGRDAAVGVHPQELGRLAVADEPGRHVLVGHAEFLDHPQRPDRTALRLPVDLQGHLLFSSLVLVRMPPPRGGHQHP
jgi:hypothetical protein